MPTAGRSRLMEVQPTRTSRSARFSLAFGLLKPRCARPATMAAYLVANYDVVDVDRYKEYQKGSAPIMAGGGKLVVFDRASVVKEGEGGAQTVIIEYPTKDAALAAYESDEYQAVMGIRLEATDNGRAVIVDGMG